MAARYQVRFEGRGDSVWEIVFEADGMRAENDLVVFWQNRWGFKRNVFFVLKRRFISALRMKVQDA